MSVSLRARLFRGVFGSTTLLLGLLCIILYTVTRNTLIGQFDASLLSTARIISAGIESEEINPAKDTDDDNEEKYLVEHLNRRIELEFDIRMTPELQNPNGGSYYQIWDIHQNLIAASPSLAGGKLPFFKPTAPAASAYQQCSLPDGKPGRAVSLWFYPVEDSRTQNEPFTLIVARDASGPYGFLKFFRLLMASCSIVIVLLAGCVSSAITRTGLKPVRTLAAEIDSIDETQLQKSLAATDYPDELTPICDRLNAFMQRLEKSFQRERQFNADVAHELRTPLAGLQSTIEVCLTRTRQPQEYQKSLEDCLTITKAMNRLTSTLLSLSRLESQQITLRTQTIPLKELIDRTWKHFADKACDKQINIEKRIDDSLYCVTDKDHLSMIISNLLDNAVEYCNNQGNITISAQQSEKQIDLTISNTGSTLKQDDAEHIFDFFWRADTARTDAGSHCGIGLAVVQKVAAALNILVTADLTQDSIFIVQLTLPKDN